MGRRMSGGDNWASTLPSTNSTNEWMTDSGWMTTARRSAGMSNSQRASITSRALFNERGGIDGDLAAHAPGRMVASACSMVACRRSASALAAERPAAAGQHEPFHVFGRAALQRLEDGRMLAIDRAPAARRACLANSMTSGPAMTRVSLLATATVLPASRAAQVPASPAAPTMAETTVSVSRIGGHAADAVVASASSWQPSGRSEAEGSTRDR